ncbi:MAG: hypothetical protein AB2653_14370, partial [Candidatus Thiodiazotropha endolucinida]
MKDEFLNVCQVETPHYIVEGMWKIASKYRQKISQVIDYGAGDGRFASSDLYESYLGYEFDPDRLPCHNLPHNAHIITADAFTSQDEACLCIGNPPYIRASGLDREWRESIARMIEAQIDLKLMRNANLFVYFLFLALLRTKKDGLVVQLVPFEWVSRPSVRPLRDYIQKNGWNVNVYRFNEDIFDNVLTTVSITVIDKSKSEGCWRYYELSKDFQEAEILQPSGTNRKVISYGSRHRFAYALRGLSPGGQDIFTLTEHQRLFYGLKVDEDVSRCITSLRNLPADVFNLTETAFKKHYVNAGQKCWLIRSDRELLSKNLKLFIDSIGRDVWGKYSTCTERDIWWKYRIHPGPRILVASGFRNFGPKIVKNSIKSIAVGAVYGVFTKNK